MHVQKNIGGGRIALERQGAGRLHDGRGGWAAYQAHPSSTCLCKAGTGLAMPPPLNIAPSPVQGLQRLAPPPAFARGSPRHTDVHTDTRCPKHQCSWMQKSPVRPPVFAKEKVGGKKKVWRFFGGGGAAQKGPLLAPEVGGGPTP